MVGTPSFVGVTENTPTKYVATYQFSESATTKQLDRTVINDSAGNEIIKGYGAAVSFARPNNTVAYAGNNVIGPSLSLTSAMTFNVGPANGAEVVIQSTELEIDSAGLITGEGDYKLFLYSGAPPSAYVDNTVFDLGNVDRPTFLGWVDLGTPALVGSSTLYVRKDNVGTQITLASGAVYGYLVSVGGYTPTANRVYKVTLHTQRPTL